jgi:hypothetical protein
MSCAFCNPNDREITRIKGLYDAVNVHRQSPSCSHCINLPRSCKSSGHRCGMPNVDVAKYGGSTTPRCLTCYLNLQIAKQEAKLCDQEHEKLVQQRNRMSVLLEAKKLSK